MFNKLHTNLAPFAPEYDVRGRLQALGVSPAFISGSGPYFPWAASTATGENYSPVTIGQLKIAFSFDLPASIRPTIISQPLSLTVGPGGATSFSVAATGTPTLIYQWRKNGSNLTNGGNVSGSTSTTLTITNVQSADAASYTVVVSNNAGSVTSILAALSVSDDIDGDGLSDAWETQYFGSLINGANADYDGDGLSNLVEWQTGLDPTYRLDGISLPSEVQLVLRTPVPNFFGVNTSTWTITKLVTP